MEGNDEANDTRRSDFDQKRGDEAKRRGARMSAKGGQTALKGTVSREGEQRKGEMRT